MVDSTIGKFPDLPRHTCAERWKNFQVRSTIPETTQLRCWCVYGEHSPLVVDDCMAEHFSWSNIPRRQLHSLARGPLPPRVYTDSVAEQSMRVCANTAHSRHQRNV